MTRKPMDFGAMVAQAEDALCLKEPAVRHVEARLFATPFSRHGTRPRLSRRPVALAASVSLVVAASLLMIFSILRESPLDLEVDGKAVASPAGTWVEAMASERKTLRFSDGTRITLASATGARVIETTPRGARVLVERGAVRAHIVHHEDTDWTFEVGPFSIRVTGTSFDVIWQPDAGYFSVTLHKGSVEVEGPNLAVARVVSAGETLRTWGRTAKVEQVSTRYDRLAIAAQGSWDPGEVPSAPPAYSVVNEESRGGREDEPDAPQGENPTLSPDRTATTTPRGQGLGASVLSSAGDVRTSTRVERISGLSERARMSQDNPEPPSPATPTLINKRIEPIETKVASGKPEALSTPIPLSDQMKRADQARLAGNHEEAKQSYMSIRRDFGGTREAALSAFALGRIAFDHERDYASAAEWFRTYLAEQSGTPLGREALGRLMESQHRAGNPDEAMRTAKQYLERYASGPHAALARTIIGETEER